MKYGLSSLARSGLIALGVLAGVPLLAAAGPAELARMPMHSAQDSAIAPTEVNHWGRNGWRGDAWRHGGGRGWNNNWNNNWRGRYRPYYGGGWGRGYWGGSGIYLNFSVPAYRYDPYYDGYYRPRYYAPRRALRLSSAHIQWCYNRYRSYRDWDNTFQPYNGPRRECWSPYS
ncbi:MAG: hypothetical protein ABS58_10625 [Mesorhizobium sp. SCN 65-20]|nr:MAG: hypothetical protein ABS58_10625 [Mesorhizobium sp. SCN 65-20]